MSTTTSRPPTLHVCTTCGAGTADEKTGGDILFAEVQELVPQTGLTLRLRGVQCLANCDRGGSASLSIPGRRGELIGGLAPGMAQELIDHVAAQIAAATEDAARRPVGPGEITMLGPWREELA